MVRRALLWVSLFSGLAVAYRDGKDSHVLGASEHCSAAATSGPWQCCCSTAPPDSCEYLAVASATESESQGLCCYSSPQCALEGYSASDGGHCRDADPGRNLEVRLRAHPEYQLLDAATRLPAPQFQAASPLGAGSFGVVFLAKHRVSNGLRAVKMAISEPEAELLVGECDRIQQVHERMEAGGPEALAGAPHVMRCLEKHPDYSPPFAALEFAGRPSHEALAGARHGRALQLLKQVFIVLHAFEVSKPPTVHHDLKWENMVVADNGCLKVIDMDTAHPGVRSHSDVREMADGSIRPPEAAPDVCFACGPNEASEDCPWAYSFDAYSAGVMALQSLCGPADLAVAKQWFHARDSKRQFEFLKRTFQESVATGMSPDATLYLQALSSTQMAVAGQSGFADQVSRMETTAEVVFESHLEDMTDLPDGSGDAFKRSREAFEDKIRFCGEHLGELELLDRLRGWEPSERPKPSDVLNSALFNNVATGCSDDP